jgi:3-dehydroquinate synthase
MKNLSNRIITINRTPIFFGNDSLPSIDKLVARIRPDGIFILVDPNTMKYCLPLLMEKTESLATAKVILTNDGERAKSLQQAEKIWNELLISGAGRSSLLINLGGGVISDLGGFVAAGYHRGISYINVPTTLMAQADAAIGGKTAVNLGHLKNQVGFFYPAKAVVIFPGFLQTLPLEHKRSGIAEIIKCALIGNAALWKRLQKNPVIRLLDMPVECALWQKLILATATFKNRVVVKDYREQKIRKSLNFGHTAGHAFEGFSQMGITEPLLHGDAVAAGMICAAYLSHRKTGLSRSDLESIASYINDGFGRLPIDPLTKPQLMDIMMHDKKTHAGRLLFTLISKPGVPVLNVACGADEISEAIDYQCRLFT